MLRYVIIAALALAFAATSASAGEPPHPYEQSCAYGDPAGGGVVMVFYGTPSRWCKLIAGMSGPPYYGADVRIHCVFSLSKQNALAFLVVESRSTKTGNHFCAEITKVAKTTPRLGWRRILWAP